MTIAAIVFLILVGVGAYKFMQRTKRMGKMKTSNWYAVLIGAVVILLMQEISKLF